VSKSIEKRLAQLDWEAIYQSLWSYGYALTAPLLTAEECGELIEMYPRAEAFRSHIVMERYRFGRGDYKYFDYPLPAVVQDLRAGSYPRLAGLANQWNRAMVLESSFPPEHEPFLAQCHKAGQTRATCDLSRRCPFDRNQRS
jgi:hypothetical protein